MEGTDYFRAIVRWIHAVAAVAWVGGSIFYLFVLRPSMEQAQLGQARAPFEQAINKYFRPLVDISIIALILTGVIITFDRFQSANITATYYVVLSLKLLAVLSMFLLARDLGTRVGRLGKRSEPKAEPSLSDMPSPSRTGWRKYTSPSRLILILGLIAFFLSTVLVHVYESDVRGL